MYVYCVEKFWLAAQKVVSNADDQAKINCVLDSMGVKWEQLITNFMKHGNQKYYQGVTNGITPLTVTTLPEILICRRCVREALVWHRRGGSGVKIPLMTRYKLWLLNDNWNPLLWNTTYTLSPEQWLLNVTVPK